MTNDNATLLVTATGHDRPGLTSRLFEVLSQYDADVLDLEQITIRGRLTLAALITDLPQIDRLRTDLDALAGELSLDITVSTGSADPGQAPELAHVTVIGFPLRPAAMAALAGRINKAGGNIDRIERLASYPVTSIQLEVSGVAATVLKAELADEALREDADWNVDVAVQPAGLLQRAKRLVVMDVDSTLVQGEVIEMLAERAGTLDEVAKVTAAAMRGELDFEQSLRARVKTLAGLPASELSDVRKNVRLTPGARTLVRTLKRLDYKCAIVSGGFTQITNHLVEELGVDYAAANTLEVADGKLTGNLTGPILDRAGKATALMSFASAAGVPLTQTVAVGDGANDLDMIAAAGLGIAFNAKPIVRSAADTTVNVPYLDAILFLLGISRADIEAADLAEGLPTPTAHDVANRA
jgi:phosphoserine phosphatase